MVAQHNLLQPYEGLNHQRFSVVQEVTILKNQFFPCRRILTGRKYQNGYQYIQILGFQPLTLKTTSLFFSSRAQSTALNLRNIE